MDRQKLCKRFFVTNIRDESEYPTPLPRFDAKRLSRRETKNVILVKEGNVGSNL